MALELAKLDGRVELREPLGAGGMGEVHAAWDRSLERAVAVKFVRGGDPREAERLLLEARLQARVEHPHVVRVFEVGSLQGRPCILFQLVRGKSLAELAPALSVADRVELCSQAAGGLHAAHLQGLVHRDVKPGNILVEESDDGQRTALVTDFGLAHAEEGGLTRSGLLLGTLDFMAPEQLAGSGPIDFRSDVYALGATLYALLAGRAPFRIPSAKPEAEEQVKLLRRILDEEPPSLRSVAPELPRELSLVVQKAMEKEPAARYGSAEAFADDLARFQRGEPVNAKPTSRAERLLKWTRRNPVATRALAAAALVLLAAGAFALWQARRASAEALEAARLGAEAEQMHELLRVEMLLPAHDLTPAFARIRELLAPLSTRPATVAAGAAAFTLGRGRQLLGDHLSAYRELSRAWELGFRRPEAARALSESEGRLYALELVSLGRIDDPERKKARLAELARRFRDPAAARLRELAGATEADQLVLSARLALVEQRFDDAAAAARQAAAAGADPLETGELEGEALLLGGNALRERGDTPGAEALLTAAASALERTAAVGRSAPGPRLLLARVRVVQADLAANRQGLALAPLEAIATLLHEAEKLDPGGAEVHNVWAGLEKRRGDALSAAGQDPLPALRAAVAHAERAEAASRQDPRIALLQLAVACNALAGELGDRGEDPIPALDQGIAASERARALAPDASGPLFNLAQLRTSRAAWIASHGADGRAGASAGVADARRFLELGDRPVVARNILAKALEAQANAEWLMGGDGDTALAEGMRLLDEAVRLAPKNWQTLHKGLSLSFARAGMALDEGRDPEPALKPGLAWAEALLPLAEGNVYFAASIGALQLVRGRAELRDQRDPGRWLERAEPLLERSAASYGLSSQLLGEVELARAAWAASRGGDTAPQAARALARAVAAQKLDPRNADALVLEARALLARPRPVAGELERARAAVAKALALNPRLGRAWLEDARARRALGDPAGARASLDRAAACQPRLAEIAELRRALAH